MELPKAIYIIGGGPLGINIIRWAKELGLNAIVTDKNTDAPGFAIADEKLIADGTDIDAHTKFAELIGEEYKIVGVYCGSEFGLWAIYHLSNKLGLKRNSYQSIKNVLNKKRMKNIWKAEGIPSPDTHIVQNPDELRDFAQQDQRNFIIKPARGSGSRGVLLVKFDSNFELAFKLCKESVDNQGDVIIEPFVEGRSIDANGIFLDGKFYGCGVLEKFSTPSPHFLPIGGYDPADIPEEEVPQVYELLEKACRSVSLTFGPVKGDFIRADNGYIVLEVAPRFHGDVTTSNTLPHGSGINPVKFYFKYLSEGVIDNSLVENRDTLYATWRVICLPPGNDYKNIFEQELTRDFRISMIWFDAKYNKKGKRYTDTTQIPGYVCAYGQSKSDAEAVLEEFFSNDVFAVQYKITDRKWYKDLGKSIEEAGFSKKSCGFIL